MTTKTGNGDIPEITAKTGGYDRYIRRKKYMILITSLLCLGSALYALCSGSSGLGLSQVLESLTGKGDVLTEAIVFNIRMPRIVTAVLAVSALGVFIFFTLNRWNYNAMESGADTAKSLGVNVDRVTVTSMLAASFAASVAVAFVGIISFVGLIAPHIMRRFMGRDHRYLLGASASLGALILIVSDTFGRLIVAPVILPIGAIMSFLGAPMFLYILFKGAGVK